MVKNARLNGVIVAGIMWVVYCICLLTGQYVVADILSPLCASIAQMAVSRQREYLADASAVNITRYPEGMISALKKLQAHSQPMKRQNSAAASMYINNPLRKGFLSNLFSTHPPIEKRIERLEHGKNTF